MIMNLVSFLFFALLFPFFLLTPIFLLVLLSPPPYIPCYQSVRLFTFFFRLIKSPKDTSVFLFICPRDFFFWGRGKAAWIYGIFSGSRNFSTIFNCCFCPIFSPFMLIPLNIIFHHLVLSSTISNLVFKVFFLI